MINKMYQSAFINADKNETDKPGWTSWSDGLYNEISLQISSLFVKILIALLYILF